jgi:hypothetical protein
VAAERRCGTCALAEWANGPREAGRCGWVEEPRVLAWSITSSAFYRESHPRTAVWQNNGRTCPVWRMKPEDFGKPIRRRKGSAGRGE